MTKQFQFGPELKNLINGVRGKLTELDATLQAAKQDWEDTGCPNAHDIFKQASDDISDYEAILDKLHDVGEAEMEINWNRIKPL